ncbi:hypothetical protein [Flavobacterium pedocola]
MKKIIAFFVLFLAFTSGVAAQTQNKGAAQSQNTADANEVNAKRDYEAVAAVIQLTPETQDALIAVLRKKYDALSQPNMTDARRDEIKAIIEKKLQKVLGPDILKQLGNHPSVYKQLVSDTSL